MVSWKLSNLLEGKRDYTKYCFVNQEETAT